MAEAIRDEFGRLARGAGYQLPLQVLHSRSGYYLGTTLEDAPLSRESSQYWPTAEMAAEAWQDGRWTQRLAP